LNVASCPVKGIALSGILHVEPFVKYDDVQNVVNENGGGQTHYGELFGLVKIVAWRIDFPIKMKSPVQTTECEYDLKRYDRPVKTVVEQGRSDSPVTSGIIAHSIAHTDDSPDVLCVCRIVGKVIDKGGYTEERRHQDNQYFAPSDGTDSGEMIHSSDLQISVWVLLPYFSKFITFVNKSNKELSCKLCLLAMDIATSPRNRLGRALSVAKH
jgi:hypothetical protein